MTFPNWPSYIPGSQRRDPKCAMSTQTIVPKRLQRRSLEEKELEVKKEGMQQDLQSMLVALSPAHGETAALQSIPTKEESLALVGQSRKRLLADENFHGNEGLLLLANNTAAKVSSDAVDPFAALIEKMPTNSLNYQGVGTTSDGLSSSDTSRSQYMEAVSLQTMARAASEVVEDETVRARYEDVANKLHEWGERRMIQQQQQSQSQASPVNTERGDSLLPSLSMSLAEISPYAMELAARNSLPKKRSSLSKLSKKLMHDWFEHNLHHPYPTEEEKEWLARQGGITLEQVNNWFINTRGRKWKPMLNRLMAEKQAGDCKLYDQMVEKIEEPYHKF
ncbi:unnamed protein product [Peronospora destructor]|uniref:Homeobox domain-containing protein n=1 Tax=Peronospora destructor TaxID=86335 RepID=A0AAV0VGF1_9STRA|nr:unnamed protein product [Peronospora destructor]